MKRAKAMLGLALFPFVGFSSGASAQSITISGPTTANVGDRIVLDIVADATGGTPDNLAYARVRWDSSLASGVSMVPTPQSTTFISGGSGLRPGQANAVNVVNNPFTSTDLPNQTLGGQLTLDLIASGTLNVSFDAPFPLLQPRFFGLPAGHAGTWQVVVPESSRTLLLSAGALGLAVIGRKRAVRH